MALIPKLSYLNPQLNKYLIYKDNNKKSGIYMWINLLNNKCYIGSSVSLNSRFSTYFSKKILEKRLKKESSIIYKAILKYDYNMFRLDILEYCEIDVILHREQYYIDLLKPEYNILKVAGSRLGSKHNEYTKIKISNKVKGINHPFYGKEHSDETKIKLKESLKLYNQNTNVKRKYIPKSSDIKSKLSLNYKGIKIYVYDKNHNFVNLFPSIVSAAKYFNISSRTMGRRLAKGCCNKFIYKHSSIN